MRASRLAPLALTAVLFAAACSSSGGGGSVPDVGAAAQPDAITFTGAVEARVTATLCSTDTASVIIRVPGDSVTYTGSLSSTTFGFVGPDTTEYVLKSGRPKRISTDAGTSYTVSDVRLVDPVGGKTVTANGTISCP